MFRRTSRWIALLLLVGAGAANAFKIDTHLWIADYLLPEICAGAVNIDSRAIGLPSLVRDSISRHPDAFRIGVLGADLYPDLVAGQMTTHPGLPPRLEVEPGRVSPSVAAMAANFGRPLTGTVRGWQTDDWLAFVRAEAFARSQGKPSAEIAFAFGYLLHAAMDTWAHSYVNLYTGDLFSIVDNQEIAARHTVLEVFIKQVHEPYVRPVAEMRPNGCAAGPAMAGDRRRSAVDNLSVHAAPTRFVRDTLILHPAVANQYARTPGAQHVYAMWLVWDLAGRSRSEWQTVRGTLDTLVEQASAAVFEADQAWDLAEQAKATAAAAAEQALIAKQQAEETAADAARGFADVLGDVLAVLASNPAVQATEATVESFLHLLPQPLRSAYFQAKNAALNADKALEQAVDAYDTAAADSSALAAEALTAFEAFELKQSAQQAAVQAREAAWTAVDTGLDGWRENVESAVDAYVLAFEETAREIMRGSGTRFRKGANVTWPLKEWAACWGPLFGMPALPLPPRLAAGACQSGLSAYNHARQNLTLLKNNAAFDLLGLSHLKAPIEEFEESLHERVRDGMPLAGQLLNDSVGGNAEQIPGSASFVAALWDKHVDAQDLNVEFADDSSAKNLPVYAPAGEGSVTAMLDVDGLPLNGTANSMQAMLAFAPVANAVNLSRLTLLNGSGLNRLVESYRVRGSSYADGAPAYPMKAPPGAVLVGAIRSIDGNHQWQPVAPPLPRQMWDPNAIAAANSVNLADGECRRFGYPATASYGGGTCGKDDHAAASTDFGDWLALKDGFRLWLDPQLREAVFHSIFAGPLSVAVCKRLGADAAQHAAIGCASGEPFPASAESAAIVAGFVNDGAKRVAIRQPPAAGSKQRRAQAPAKAGGPVPATTETVARGADARGADAGKADASDSAARAAEARAAEARAVESAVVDPRARTLDSERSSESATKTSEPEPRRR